MIDAAASPQAKIDAYLHASILLDRIVPGSVVDDIDSLRHIRYGRPKRGVQHEIIAAGVEPDRVLAVLAAHRDRGLPISRRSRRWTSAGSPSTSGAAFRASSATR